MIVLPYQTRSATRWQSWSLAFRPLVAVAEPDTGLLIP